MSPDAHDAKTYRIDCPECDWTSREFEKFPEETAAKVDAELHYVESHGGRIPEDAPFGNEQCPECFGINGLNGTASCSQCGHIPEEARLVPEGSSA